MYNGLLFAAVYVESVCEFEGGRTTCSQALCCVQEHSSPACFLSWRSCSLRITEESFQLSRFSCGMTINSTISLTDNQRKSKRQSQTVADPVGLCAERLFFHCQSVTSHTVCPDEAAVPILRPLRTQLMDGAFPRLQQMDPQWLSLSPKCIAAQRFSLKRGGGDS